MNGRSLVLVLIVLLGLGGREALWAEWARLKDGSIVRVTDRKANRVAVADAQGRQSTLAANEIDGLLSAPVAARIVNDMMALIGRPEHHETVREKLKQIGMAAVPQLLVHLRSRDLDQRRAALAGLQMAWSSEAENPVSSLLNDDDAYCRQMALHLVNRHFPAERRRHLLGTLAESSEDPQLQGPALAVTLSQTPDADRMLQAMRNPAFWEDLHALLPRYQSTPFREISLRLLDKGTPEAKASALVALIYQMDNRPDTRKRVASLLTQPSPNLRELAAEYLRWHGTPKEINAMENQAKEESDPFVAAALEAATTAILRRATRFAASPKAHPIPTEEWPTSLAEAYEEAARQLTTSPDNGTRQRVLDLLARETLEPVYHYAEKWRLRPDTRHRYHADALSLAFGYPSQQERRKREQAAFGNASAALNIPLATELGPPVRDYFDPQRESFGLFVDPERNHPFSNRHHVGDDVSFGAQQRTVVAIGAGLVRVADTGLPSWGGLVVIEHRAPDGSLFCSLYGHLGPLIDVQAGDRVERGQKLGTLGRDHVFATGGYRSHLHFGIHRSEFTYQGRAWITGYLSPQRYQNKKEHRWVDPQGFVKARLPSAP